MSSLTEIKNSSSAWNNYFPIIRNYQDDAFLNEVVTLMYFNYKTSKRFVWKKKDIREWWRESHKKGRHILILQQGMVFLLK